jgi:pimeloyl-ACP methyl ester carboxylesterase
MNLAGVAFGHDWLAGADRYDGTLEHLASWGIVAAAPNTETSVVPSVLNLAFDLGTTLDIISGVRLGPGKISVHPTKLGVVGHGFGGSAAVFAAAGMPNRLKAAAALFPTVTTPPAAQPARGLRVPGLILAAPSDPLSIKCDAAELSAAWRSATLRTVAKAEPGGLVEGFRLTRIVGLPGADKATQKTVRALLTGYLLNVLTDDKTYRDFADADVELPRTVAPAADAVPFSPEEKVAALLKR